MHLATPKFKGENEPGVVEGEKETNEDTNLCKDIESIDVGPTNFLRPDSPTLDGGSGLKEVSMWNTYAKVANNKGSTSSSMYKSPRSCEVMMEAASTCELAKNIGIGFGKEENGMLSKMVILDGRDKSELEKLGRRMGDQ